MVCSEGELQQIDVCPRVRGGGGVGGDGGGGGGGS